MSSWMLVAGAGLILAAFYDALSTTLLTGTSAGPLSSRLSAAWWRLARRIGRHPRSPWIVSVGPTVLLLTVVLWLLLLWAGWTLVFSAAPEAVVSSTTRAPAGGWSRVYFAGFTVFTLGVGDYVPNGAVWEVLTSVAVLSGLGLTTASITYLVPVVTAVTERRTQASIIAGLGTTPADLVVSGWHRGSFAYLGAQLARLSDGLLLTAERHLSYPILKYFHSRQRHDDLRVQLVVLDEAVSLLALGVDEDVQPHPNVLAGLRRAIAETVGRAARTSKDRPAPPPPSLGPLEAAGIPTVDDATFRQRLADLSEHRRRVGTYADESLWTQHRRDADRTDGRPG